MKEVHPSLAGLRESVVPVGVAMVNAIMPIFIKIGVKQERWGPAFTFKQIVIRMFLARMVSGQSA